MNYTLEGKYALIRHALLTTADTDPAAIARELMHSDFVSMHGPEHHFLDGAAFLAAFRNAGGEIDLRAALSLLAKRSISMPGAMCGEWGVCGAVASVGAALAIIHKTGPRSSSHHYKEHMQYVSRALSEIGSYGGPRCCKRNGLLAIILGVRYLNETYGLRLSATAATCDFSGQNSDCIGAVCPFFNPNKKKD